MDENTTRNQKTVYYKKRFRRKRRNKGVAIAEKYANKKWVKRQKSSFRGFVYYYLGRVQDYLYLFFHPSVFVDYKGKKIELDSKAGFEKHLRSIEDKQERERWEFEYSQRYDVHSPEAAATGCADGCSAYTYVGCTYIFVIIAIVLAFKLIFL